MPQSNKAYKKRQFVGVVTSDKMNKTVVVRIGTVKTHPVFRKGIKRFKKVKAHDEKNAAKVGDVVRIQEARPLSREKCWELVKIVQKAE